ncbi:MAG: amino acid adenylation domain-containing protein, partial [Gemmatimonadaceae bacterium]|nr:amino acid adenylation domain-containing protein [Gloeobacterales cyanobacterium ES-bin-141]
MSMSDFARRVSALTPEQRRLLELQLQGRGIHLSQLQTAAPPETSQALTPDCLHHLFETQVEQTADSIALVYADTQLSYRQLNTRANQLAHYLQSLGLKPGEPIAVRLERSIELVVSLLAILKAGGTCVPLDTAEPTNRSLHNLKDSSLSRLITHSTEEPLSAHFNPIYLDEIQPTLAQQPQHNPVAGATPAHLACLLYPDSRPLAVEHRALSRGLQALQARYPLTGTDTILHKAPLATNIALWEIFWPLVSGSRLVIAPGRTEVAAPTLLNLAIQQKVTLLHLAPSELSALAAINRKEWPSTLRCVISSGEPLPQAVVDAFLPDATRLDYAYAPPETAAPVTFQSCRAGEIWETVPVGLPVEASVYVLDRHLKLVPVGVTGEIYISETALACGEGPAASRPELVADPFATTPGQSLFKTGERGRWLTGGILELAAGEQVWVRGRRFRPDEVTAVLLQEPSVQECTVLVRQTRTGTQQLVAYIVPAGPFQPERLTTYLQTELTPAMQPDTYIAVSTLPLTNAGQIDTETLFALEAVDLELARDWEAQLQSLPAIEQVAVVIEAHRALLP